MLTVSNVIGMAIHDQWCILSLDCKCSWSIGDGWTHDSSFTLCQSTVLIIIVYFFANPLSSQISRISIISFTSLPIHCPHHANIRYCVINEVPYNIFCLSSYMALNIQ
eukprot:436552_1